MASFRTPFDTAIQSVTQSGAPFEIARAKFAGIEYLHYVNAPTTLTELLAAGRGHGDKEFIVYQQERWSFAEFYDQADRLAAQLTDAFKIKPGERVAIAMRNYPEWLSAFVAITSIGAVIVPINSWGQAAELHQNLADAAVTLVICDEARLNLIDPTTHPIAAIVARATQTNLPAGCHHFSEVINRPAPHGDRPDLPIIDSEATAMIMYTSGTSGVPKGALFSHRNCCQAIINFEAVGAAVYMTNVEAYTQHAARGVPSKTLLTVPLFHVSGLLAQFLLILRGGRTLVMMYKWDPFIACQLIAEEKISVVIAAPSMLLELIENDEFARIDADNIIAMSGAGAATPPRLRQLIETKVQSALPGAGWGMTETGAAGTSFTGQFIQHKPGSCGFLNPIVELRFFDDQTNEVAKGEPGEIWIKSPTVISGYCNAPDANQEEFTDGWFKTGDIGFLDEDDCLYICDRAKDMVIRGGENIYPIEVENCILSIPGVIRVAAFGIPSERFGEELAAVIQQAPAGEPILTEQHIQTYCRTRLAGFKIPSQIKFTTAEFPVNPTNKVLKKQLREQFYP